MRFPTKILHEFFTIQANFNNTEQHLNINQLIDWLTD
jgi:hypothetical protein